ncbi:MAG: preprotein translocase subunit YajC [Oscillospiraceae bacterium]|jgi:preprotein translocase subunit YajC|nr:preprotein translocase subunit YajC [Oscillospiraceae bacterium]
MYPTLLAATSDPVGSVLGAESALPMIASLGLMVVVFYFLLIRPERKRSKKLKSMIESMQVADEVITASGVIGIVVSVKEDSVVIETGPDKTKIRFLKTAVVENRTVHDDVS